MKEKKIKTEKQAQIQKETKIQKKDNRRKAGILMHISSIPSKYGIGKLGKAAYDFVDFLVEADIKCWQILPLSPTSFGDSPYQSFSIYAGNPYFIDFDLLKHDGLLKRSDYDNIKWQDSEDEVNYTKIYKNVFSVLKIAYKNYRGDLSDAFLSFCGKNAFWLDDYALFMALKFKNDGKSWYEWDTELKTRDIKAIKKAEDELKSEIEFFKFLQYKFFKQWLHLKSYANSKGIKIIGDIPIYCAYDSVEVWCMPEIFQLDKDKKPVSVAGCPPDDYSVTGQLWGNPLYNWFDDKNNIKKEIFDFWTKRIKFAVSIYDTTRIDHFRGFESYYSIPYGDENACNGEWKKGPGAELFKRIESILCEEGEKLPLIAEDLGFLTDEVKEMLHAVGYPGMKVIEFAFGDGSRESAENVYLPHNYTTSNVIVYTGTHDNSTLKGWVNSLNKKTLKHCCEYLDVERKKQIPPAVIKLTWASCADVAVAQIQDFLGLDDGARMNIPSTLGCNWKYRVKEGELTPELAKGIKNLNKMYNR